MPTIASRAAARLAVTVALVALVTGGCGGGTKTDGAQTNTSQAGVGQTNGLEKQSAAQVQQAAAAALKAAKSVHVKGMALDQDKPVRLDLRIQGDASTGTMGWKA